MELFKTEERIPPLAWRMQPRDFGDFLGQSHLLGPRGPLRRLIEEDKIVSLIFYGPPGTGKTALAHIIARKTKARFLAINAVTAGVRDIRQSIETGRGEKAILFVDEIHRFNKLQQDALLPAVETGRVILIGASTENPFFALVPALSSRSLIFQFRPLSEKDLEIVVNRALAEKHGLGEFSITADQDAISLVASMSQGDARRALNILEIAFLAAPEDDGGRRIITREGVQEALQSRVIYYDEDDHYDTMSAFIKSMRGSDPDAAVYWLAKMIEAGEDPLFIARRIIICAAEDVGNADPRALVLSVSAMHALERIGMPEGRIPLAQAAIYVACAPKSNAAYKAIEGAQGSIRNEPLRQVPGHLRDTSYRGARRLGAGEGYLYPHAYKDHYVRQEYMPDPRTFYSPSTEGYERVIQARLQKRRTASDD